MAGNSDIGAVASLTKSDTKHKRCLCFIVGYTLLAAVFLKTMWKLDIEIYEKWGKNEWAQAKYLVRGHDDVLWTNDLDEAISFLRASAVAVS